jgi:hypothetical protein
LQHIRARGGDREPRTAQEDGPRKRKENEKKTSQEIQFAKSPEALEHDPEKWKPVFRKDHAQTKS